MTDDQLPRAPEHLDDAAFLMSVASRLSTALYYVRTGPVGLNGSISPGLRHDDYDRLRALARRMKVDAARPSVREQLQALRGYPTVNGDKDGGSIGWSPDPIGAYLRWDDLP